MGSSAPAFLCLILRSPFPICRRCMPTPLINPLLRVFPLELFLEFVLGNNSDPRELLQF